LFYRDTLDYKVDDEPQNRKIQIEYQRGERGTELIQIVQVYKCLLKHKKTIVIQRFDKQVKLYKNDSPDQYQYLTFPNIPIEDFSNLQNALQIMFNDLQKKSSSFKSSIICPQFIKGLQCDYKMEFYSCKNQQLGFRLKAIPNEANLLHKPMELLGPIPINVFHWLQEQIAEISVCFTNSL
jgi:hypothetical protein